MKSKFRLTSFFAFLIVIFCFSSIACAQKLKIGQVEFILKPNTPVGEAHGIMSGRVAWAHISGTAMWNGKSKNWYDDSFNSQDNCDKMMTQVLMSITNTQSSKEAWKMLFADFNKQREKKQDYQNGETIVIKINMNNTSSHDDSEEINASPQMVLSLMRSLVKEAEVPQEYIIIAEPSRFITEYMYKKIVSEFPKIHFVDNSGGDGREKATYSEKVIQYSAGNGKLADGIAECFVKADYVINFALLKGHFRQGVTLCAKNWYGATNIYPDWWRNAHNNFDQNQDGTQKYMTFVDFMGHKDFGGKTMLYLIDGLYGSRNLNGAPSGKWKMPPFNNDYPNSLFASQDAVAIDAVGIDFICTEFPTAPNVNFSDTYLLEAATADSPVSKTIYDPEGDGTPLKSLGVAEHWNNPNDKQYSRNLDKNKGIELIYIK